MRLLPPSHAPRQTAAIVVDLGHNSSGQAARQGALPAAVEQLARLFADYQAAVSWAMDETAGHDLVRAIRQHNPAHDIVLRAAGNWAGAAAGRGTFARGLSRRIQQAESAGLCPAALAADEPLDRENLDLLVKYGLPLVVRLGGGETRGGAVRTLRYGLWELTAVPLPAEKPGGWLPFGGGGGRARQEIERAVHEHALCSVAVDALRLVSEGKLAALDKLMRQIHSRQRQGVLSLQTLGTVAGEMVAAPQPRGAGSILRAAA